MHHGQRAGRSIYDPMLFDWRNGSPAPKHLSLRTNPGDQSERGTAVSHEGTIYCSCGYEIHSYVPSADRWTRLPSCEHEDFSLAVVFGRLTAIGGQPLTNSLSCLMGGLGGRCSHPCRPLGAPRPPVWPPQRWWWLAGGGGLGRTWTWWR